MKRKPALPPPPPRYDEWFHFCFGRFENADPAANEWELIGECEFDADNTTLLNLFEATMSRSGTDLVSVSPKALAMGLRVMFYAEPTTICDRLCRAMDLNASRTSAITSIARLYLDCIETRDLPFYQDDLSTAPEHYPFAGHVFMLWDMSPLHYRSSSHVRALLLETLGDALMECRTEGCQQSLLHGLAHFCDFGHSRRVHAIVDGFLKWRTDLSFVVRDYAERAATGHIA
ncbi:MAG: hypothetical protein ABL898_05530 [Hyphomicrobiaceae bacterium]